MQLRNNNVPEFELHLLQIKRDDKLDFLNKKHARTEVQKSAKAQSLRIEIVDNYEDKTLQNLLMRHRWRWNSNSEPYYNYIY